MRIPAQPRSLVVDDLGEVLQVTDQAGNTTSYGYDSMGQIIAITYPSGDEQAWYPKKFLNAVVSGSKTSSQSIA